MTESESATGLLARVLGLPADATPFPWQIDLLDRMLRGQVPDALDIPTGLGKTAAMAIWLVARQAGASLPRRLVYVVDRRAVVDQATDVAMGLREFVDSDPDLKARLGLHDNRPLPISTLRGKYVDNREWLERPTSPAVVVGTVDMIGSRLLFSGYGVTRKMRPYQAGLLGVDALFILDEAHLVPSFEALLRTIESGAEKFGPRRRGNAPVLPPFKVLSLSATGRISENGALALTEADREHPVSRQRLYARKIVRIEHLPSKANSSDDSEDLIASLVSNAWSLAVKGDNPARVIVFTDSRKLAVAVKEALEELGKTRGTEIWTELLVGGRRVRERESLKQKLVAAGFIGDSISAPDIPTILVATSAGEVGVDLDSEHLVCDVVAWERMVQRLGRVNRRGKWSARVVVVAQRPSRRTKEPEEAFALRLDRWEAVLELLNVLPLREAAPDAGPASLLSMRSSALRDRRLHEVLAVATTPEPLRPELDRPHVDAWSLTSLEEHTGRPAVEPWLRGWEDDIVAQTALVWRTHMPLNSACVDERDLVRFFEAAPAHASEVLDVESWRVVEWAKERVRSIRALEKRKTKLPDAGNLAETIGFLTAPGSRFIAVLDQAGKYVEALGLDELDDWRRLGSRFAGRRLMIDARFGGLNADGLLDGSVDEPPTTADDLSNETRWSEASEVGFRIRIESSDDPGTATTPWSERMRLPIQCDADGEPRTLLIVEKWRNASANEHDRSSGAPQLLRAHQEQVERRARQIALRLGFSSEWVEMLATAARVHDEGKRANRWQRAFRAPPGGPYAKTSGPISYALLGGYRHEFGSLVAAEKSNWFSGTDVRCNELGLHLLIAHHGRGRPTISTDGCDDHPPSVLDAQAARVALRFLTLQEEWGPWGLAWWESLLRAADQQASREGNSISESGQEPTGNG